MTVSPPRLHGRQKGRPLTKRKAELVSDLLPRLTITIPDAPQLISLEILFSQPVEQLWLEIGFGGGEHLAAQAARYPNFGFIGCEPFLNGIASLLAHLDDQKITNVRIFPEDAARLLDALPPASLDRCFLLFSDPWPKARHAKRRFIRPDNIARLARCLKAGAELVFATDHKILADWVAEQMAAATDFQCIYDAAVPLENWIPTRYESKGKAAGRHSVYRIFRRA